MSSLFSNTEEFAEQLGRVQSMALGSPTWDLSDNDRAALKAVLDDHKHLLDIIKLAREVRTAQRTYFKEKTDTALTRSRELERRLDGMLKE